MPNKKGSRIAASQARAKSAAKKKSHASGPDLAAAAQEVQDDPQELDEQADVAVAVVEGDETQAAAPAAAAAPAPRRVGRAASRRERQALTVMSSGSLGREVAMIGIVTAVMGVALAVIKLATDLGR
ncbi:MAG: hypothetical protein O2826_10010 [Chloroflexi bacterium]|nr:hypothetical protein [Chloroflexota bacterium]MDA1174838.1 hypothetical protein [Chloroflexota bacterium]